MIKKQKHISGNINCNNDQKIKTVIVIVIMTKE